MTSAYAPLSGSIVSEKMWRVLERGADENGVIGRAMPQGDILGFAPPLCLTKAEADEIAAKTKAAVRAVLG